MKVLFTRKFLSICLFMAPFLVVTTSKAQESKKHDPLAIVVNASSTLDGLSKSEVSRIFRSEQQFWPDNKRIILLIRAPISTTRSLVLEQIYSMNEQQFRKYWIQKMFKAEVASGPKVVYTSDMAIDLINVIPGAIAFVPFSEIKPGVKVLMIDGKLPSEDGYPW
tara:strand:+ start:1683 stop:2177 length:495 start_codon:yes stop_codon:yes gene_type:complete